jgi:hypothetical protein
MTLGVVLLPGLGIEPSGYDINVVDLCVRLAQLPEQDAKPGTLPPLKRNR